MSAILLWCDAHGEDVSAIFALPDPADEVRNVCAGCLESLAGLVPGRRPLRDSDEAGLPVEVTEDDGRKTLTLTLSGPWMAGSMRVVLLKGRIGGYLASRCQVMTGVER